MKTKSKFNGSYRKRRVASPKPAKLLTKADDRVILDAAVEAYLANGGRITRCPMGSALAGVLCNVRPSRGVVRPDEGSHVGMDVSTLAERLSSDGD